MIEKNKSRNRIVAGVALGVVIMMIAIFGRVAGENLESENLNTQINAQFLEANWFTNLFKSTEPKAGYEGTESLGYSTEYVPTAGYEGTESLGYSTEYVPTAGYEGTESLGYSTEYVPTESTSLGNSVKNVVNGVANSLGKISGGLNGVSVDTGGLNLSTGGSGSGISVQTDNFSLNTGGGSSSQPGCGSSNCLVAPDAGEYKGIAVEESFRQFLITWTNFFLQFLALIAMIALIYAGFLYVTAAGNDEQAGKAKKIIGWVVIGIIVILLAYALVNALITKAPTGSDF